MMSRGLKIVADCLIKDCVDKEWDAIALPGGMPGANHLRDCEDLKTLILAQNSKSKVCAAVCASHARQFRGTKDSTGGRGGLHQECQSSAIWSRLCVRKC